MTGIIWSVNITIINKPFLTTKLVLKKIEEYFKNAKISKRRPNMPMSRRINHQARTGSGQTTVTPCGGYSVGHGA